MQIYETNAFIFQGLTFPLTYQQLNLGSKLQVTFYEHIYIYIFVLYSNISLFMWLRATRSHPAAFVSLS